MRDAITLHTLDSVRIVGDYYPASGDAGVIALHMMPANRASWIPFAELLQRSGFRVLAIDLRGHGESDGGPDGYKNFSDEEHQASYRDTEAAADFLHAQGARTVFSIGASIGANLALQYLADHADAAAAILLSPGIDYRGVKTEPMLARMHPDQGVYFVAAADDIRQSGQSAVVMAESLYQKCPVKNKMLKQFDSAGHGTSMLEKNPGFMDDLVRWMQSFNQPRA